MVRDFLAAVTADELATTHPHPWSPEYPETTLSCLHVILRGGVGTLPLRRTRSRLHRRALTSLSDRRGYHPAVGVRNFLIEGVSGTGKTTVCRELQRRGFQAINGDRELAYQGDPETGEPTDDVGHEHHLWRVDQVTALIADRDQELTFFCGGSRNFDEFIDLFDDVFVLEVDLATLNRRLDDRPGRRVRSLRRGAGNRPADASHQRGCPVRRHGDRRDRTHHQRRRRHPRSVPGIGLSATGICRCSTVRVLGGEEAEDDRHDRRHECEDAEGIRSP